jgi:hypothetical protein
MEAYAWRIVAADAGSLQVVVAQLLFADLQQAQDVLSANESVWRRSALLMTFLETIALLEMRVEQ